MRVEGRPWIVGSGRQGAQGSLPCSPGDSEAWVGNLSMNAVCLQASCGHDLYSYCSHRKFTAGVLACAAKTSVKVVACTEQHADRQHSNSISGAMKLKPYVQHLATCTHHEERLVECDDRRFTTTRNGTSSSEATGSRRPWESPGQTATEAAQKSNNSFAQTAIEARGLPDMLRSNLTSCGMPCAHEAVRRRRQSSSCCCAGA